MELRHLRYFVAVAAELHFGRAADRLHMSQPPLSVAIRQLERDVGVELFERTTRSVALTPAGEAFRVRVQTVLDDLHEAVGVARDVAAGRLGTLRVGFVSSASVTVLPIAVRTYVRDHPGVRLDLQPLTSAEQLAALRAFDLDLGIIRGSEGAAGMEREELLHEPMVAVVPVGHPLASQHTIRPDQLVDEPLVLFPSELMPGFVSQVRELFGVLGAAPRVVQEAIHHETVVGLVAAGTGISILPESVSRFRVDEVVVREIADAPSTSLVVVRMAGRQDPVAASFVACLRASAGRSGAREQ